VVADQAVTAGAPQEAAAAAPSKPPPPPPFKPPEKFPTVMVAPSLEMTQVKAGLSAAGGPAAATESWKALSASQKVRSPGDSCPRGCGGQKSKPWSA
jgi:hypothetical protein